MKFCVAYGCKNRSDKAECQQKNISYHRFPLTNSNRLQQWLANLNRENFKPNKHSVLCSEHFDDEDFGNTACNKRVLKPGTVPSKFSLPKSAVKRTSTSHQFTTLSPISQSLCQFSAINVSAAQSSFLPEDKECQTEDDIIAILLQENQQLKEENAYLKGGSKSNVASEEQNVQCMLYEKKILSKTASQSSSSGPELAAAMKIGTRVVRGVDWEHGHQDGPPPGKGTVTLELNMQEWVRVMWDTGHEDFYRMGNSGKYELKIADPLPVEQQNSLSKSVEQNVSEKLVDDLINILEGKEHSDITIKVRDKEFQLHKNILAGRSLYFKSMFYQTKVKDYTRKATNIVSIDDCEPDIFHSFIYFLYTGRTKDLSDNNVYALYEVADKYQENQLKMECLCFMKNKISVDSFCDVFVWAVKHNEKFLLKNATEFFCRRTNEIIKGVKWQTFLREYPTQANELFIKFSELSTM